ncbi:MAG: PQQ-binding-like beta-propeller repeat protein [Proteobacteria bacterium]|nr:PQQ-binding-like beta-propeller repeat protein [Pseudomonadota bacterium]
MSGEKIARVARLFIIGVLVIFSFGAAGEICGGLFETTAAAFGSKFPDNRSEDIRTVLSQVRKADVKAGKPENSRGIPVAVMVVEEKPRAIVAWDLKAGRELWKVAPPIRSEIAIGNDLVVFQSSTDVMALNLGDGKVAWKYKIEDGWDYHGADVSGDVAAISIGVGRGGAGSYSTGRLLALNSKNGSFLWEHSSGGGLLGEPLVFGGLVFAPWDRQKIVVIDAEEAEEICRLRAIDYTINSVNADSSGVYYSSLAAGANLSMIFRFDENAATGTREGSTMFVPDIKPVPGDPSFEKDGFAEALAGRVAREKIRFHWKSTASVPNMVRMAGNQFYLHYWRYIIAFNASTGQVHWIHRSTNDIESMSAVSDGAIGIDSNGRLFFLDAVTGAEVWSQDTGHKTLAGVFDADGFKPGISAGESANPLAGLRKMVWDKDNRMLPIRSYGAFLMAAIPVPEVTRDLLEVYSDPSTPKGLRDAVVKALEKRKVGAEYLVDSLHMHYDYLEQSHSPPMNIVAPALVNMKEHSSVPGLLSRLMDHETPVDHLTDITVAIRELGNPSVVDPLRNFLTLYHADSALLEHEDALAVAAQGILKFGTKKDDEPFVMNIRDDTQTLPELKSLLRRILDPIAAAKADTEAKIEEETKAKTKIEAEIKAKAESEAAAIVPDALPHEQVNKTISENQKVLRPCVKNALGKAPTLQNIRLRFVITGATGRASDLRILPNNIPGLQECLQDGLKEIQFAKFRNLRQMATYTITILSGASSPAVDMSQPEQPKPEEPKLEKQSIEADVY